jgi:hypothetical protein
VAPKPESNDDFAGTGLPIEQYQQDAARLSADEFDSRHGGAFLLLSATSLKHPKSGTATEVNLLDFGDADEAGERTAGLAVQVFPIRAASESLMHLMTVGRTSRNDLTIPDISVSRFHAFFRRSPDNRFQLQDAGSTNGTTVNGISVCTKEAGPPTDLDTGDNIRFGQIDVTFLKADALRSFVLKFDG